MHCGHFTTSCCAFKTAFQENKLDEEIDWGINIRRDRHQEKDIILAQEPIEISVPKAKRRRKKHGKKLPKIKEIPLCQKLSERITFNRDTATFKQYVDMLARPKPIFCPIEEPEIEQVSTGVCSPRTAQMALPLKKRVFATWQNYYDVLTPEQITNLKEYLTKEEHLLPMEAYNYFKRLKREQRRKRKQKKKEEKKMQQQKPQKSKVMREINCLAKCIVKYFSEKMVQTVKCNHMCLTDIMKTKLEVYHLIPPGYMRSKEKDICGRTLFETLDQLSVWLESNISWDDEPSDDEKISTPEEGGAGEFSPEGTPEGWGREGGARGEGRGEGRGETRGEGRGETRGEGRSEAEYGRAMKVHGEREDEEESTESSEISTITYYSSEEEEPKEEESRLPSPIEEVEEEKVPSVAGEEEASAKISPAVSLAKEEDIIKEIEKIEEEYLEMDIPPEEESVKFVEEVFIEEVQPEVEVSPVKYEEAEEYIQPKEESLKELAESLEELITSAASGESGFKMDEHSPDAVCCVTLKTWATWLVDVAQNTHSWCQWIQEVIAKVRFFAAILKGEVKTPDGKRRILFKEEWEQFTDLLACDIESWQKYKEHVKELSDKIIEGFQNKRVICCSACLKSKLIISADTAHQVTEQLVEALNTTAYWRGWLDAIVEEARKLAALEFDLPSKAVTSVETSSGTYESSSHVYEIIELKSPSKTSSDNSLFFLEEIGSDNSSKSFVIEELAENLETKEETKDDKVEEGKDDKVEERRKSSLSKKP